MSIQGSFNSSLIGVAVVASLVKINQAINELGYNDYKELCGAISNLEIEIAKNEDEGKPNKKLKTLLNKYLEVRQSYNEALEKQRQEEKSRKTKAAIIFSVFSVIAIIISIILIVNLMAI